MRITVTETKTDRSVSYTANVPADLMQSPNTMRQVTREEMLEKIRSGRVRRIYAMPGARGLRDALRD